MAAWGLSGFLLSLYYFALFVTRVGFSCVSQTLGRRSDPGAVPQEEREEGDGGERDPKYQETVGEDGLQRPPQLQDNGTSQFLTRSFLV